MSPSGTSISAMIAAYNAESFLEDTLSSVLAQTRAVDQIVVVDDGSTDGTADLLATVEARHPGLFTIVHQQNSGPASARNAGVRACTGDFVAFLDHDDRWRPEKIAAQVALLDSDPAVNFCATGYTYQVDGSERIDEVPADWEDGPEAVLHRLLLRNCILTSTVVARRSMLIDVGLFDPAIWWGDEYDLWLRIGTAGERMAYVPRVLVDYRRGAANLSTKFYDEGKDAFIPVMTARFAAGDLPATIQRRRRWYLSYRQMVNAETYLAAKRYRQALTSILQAMARRPMSTRPGWVVIAVRALAGVLRETRSRSR